MFIHRSLSGPKSQRACSIAVFTNVALLLLVACCAVVWLQPVHASLQCENHYEYTFHTGPNGYPPFVINETVGENVTHTGIVVDLLDAFEAENPCFSRNYVLLTRKRATALMSEGQIYDIMFQSPLFVSEEILEFYRFTHSILTTRDVLVTSKDSDLVYESPEDLLSLDISLIRGYSYGKFDPLIEQEQISGHRVDSPVQALGMVAEGRVQGYMGNIHVSPYYIMQSDWGLDDFKFSETSLYEFDLAFLVNKEFPELYQALNYFIDNAIAEGTLDWISQKYRY